MTRLIKVLIAASLVALGVVAYFVSRDTYSTGLVKRMFDTVEYTEEDYELMRAYYNSDTAFQNTLNESIGTADSAAAMQVKELLGTSYQFRYNTRLKEHDIKGMIHIYRMSKDVLDKFGTIEDQLKELKESNAPKNAADSAMQRQLDSLMNLAREGNLRK